MELIIQNMLTSNPDIPEQIPDISWINNYPEWFWDGEELTASFIHSNNLREAMAQYLWTLDSRDIEKAQSIADQIGNISDYKILVPICVYYQEENMSVLRNAIEWLPQDCWVILYINGHGNDPVDRALERVQSIFWDARKNVHFAKLSYGNRETLAVIRNDLLNGIISTLYHSWWDSDKVYAPIDADTIEISPDFFTNTLQQANEWKKIILSKRRWWNISWEKTNPWLQFCENLFIMWSDIVVWKNLPKKSAPLTNDWSTAYMLSSIVKVWWYRKDLSIWMDIHLGYKIRCLYPDIWNIWFSQGKIRSDGRRGQEAINKWLTLMEQWDMMDFDHIAKSTKSQQWTGDIFERILEGGYANEDEIDILEKILLKHYQYYWIDLDQDRVKDFYSKKFSRWMCILWNQIFWRRSHYQLIFIDQRPRLILRSTGKNRNILFVHEEYPVTSPSHPQNTNWGWIGTFHHQITTLLQSAWHSVHILCRSITGEVDRIVQPNWVTVNRVPSIWCNLPSQDESNFLYRFSHSWHITDIVHENNIEVVEFPEYWAEGLLYWLIKKSSPENLPPMVTRLHTPTYICKTDNEEQESSFEELQKLFEKLQCTLSDHVVSVSRCLKDRIKQDGNALGDFPSTVLFNPITWEGLDSKDINTEASGNNLLYVGNFWVRKWITNLFRTLNEVFRDFPQCSLSVIWWEWWFFENRHEITHTYLLSLVDKEFHGKITFLGKRTSEEVKAAIGTATVCIFPSYFDAGPYTAMESISWWKTTIVWEKTWVADIMLDNHDCLHVNWREPEDIRKKIQRALSMTSSERAKIGQQWQQHFSALNASHILAQDLFYKYWLYAWTRWEYTSDEIQMYCLGRKLSPFLKNKIHFNESDLKKIALNIRDYITDLFPIKELCENLYVTERTLLRAIALMIAQKIINARVDIHFALSILGEFSIPFNLMIHPFNHLPLTYKDLIQMWYTWNIGYSNLWLEPRILFDIDNKYE